MKIWPFTLALTIALAASSQALAAPSAAVKSDSRTAAYASHGLHDGGYSAYVMGYVIREATTDPVAGTTESYNGPVLSGQSERCLDGVLSRTNLSIGDGSGLTYDATRSGARVSGPLTWSITTNRYACDGSGFLDSTSEERPGTLDMTWTPGTPPPNVPPLLGVLPLLPSLSHAVLPCPQLKLEQGPPESNRRPATVSFSATGLPEPYDAVPGQIAGDIYQYDRTEARAAGQCV